MEFLTEKQIIEYQDFLEHPYKLHTSEFSVLESECDMHYQAHNRLIFSLLQESGSGHEKQVSNIVEDIYAKGYAWIVNRVYANFLDIPKSNEIVRIHTWQSNVDRLGYIRDYAMFTTEGKTLGFCRSSWSLINHSQHTLVTPQKVYGDLYNHFVTSLEVFEEKPLRLRQNFADFSSAVTFSSYVGRSVIDSNNHMNNTYYSSLAEDAGDMLAEGKTLVSICMNYISELHKGETIRTEAVPEKSGSESELSRNVHETICVRTLGEDGREALRARLVYTSR